tara:strand:+ start:1175 stop:1822 length:648 start_codon:yes stop_codon:yes gene_type:complete
MKYKDYTFLIPARRNSKGLPFKNRKLLEATLDIIPKKYIDKVLVSTDDEYIIEKCKNQNIRCVKRSPENSRDESSTKDVFQEISPYVKTSNIVLLYLTYPERTWEDVCSAIGFYERYSEGSMLCKKKINTSPYLMMYEKGIHGRQIINHNLYRRQDYPDCFEISHYIGVFNKKVVDLLNNNMYNNDTVFFSIDDVIDVDTPKDLEKYNEKNKDYC